MGGSFVFGHNFRPDPDGFYECDDQVSHDGSYTSISNTLEYAVTCGVPWSAWPIAIDADGRVDLYPVELLQAKQSEIREHMLRLTLEEAAGDEHLIVVWTHLRDGFDLLIDH